jgi:Family of unknown function (DUF6252)
MPMQLKPTAMKPRNILSIALFPLLMLSLQHCKEDEPLAELEKLPPATQSGKRTFGCLVDGKAWVIEMPTHTQSDYQQGLLSVFAGVLDNKFYSNISFYVSDLNLSEKTYAFTEKANTSGSQYALYHDFNGVCGDYFTTTEYNGTVTITHIDKTNFIVSGLFEFEAYSTDCSKVIKITEGRFDIHYAP